MDAFDMPQIEEAHRQNGELYHEFLRANRLSVGLYVLDPSLGGKYLAEIRADGGQRNTGG